MRGFWLGAVIGLAVGAAGMYLGMARPWQTEGEAVVEADAGAAEPVAEDGKKRKKRRRKKGKRGAGDPEQDQFIDEVVEVSAADRKLMWKGQSVSLPARDMDFEGSSGRSLEQSEINSGVSGARSQIIGCIGSARGNAELRATITVKFLVDENGRVTRSRVKAPAYLQNNGLEPCVRRATRSMRFPATGAATVVTVPFDLS